MLIITTRSLAKQLALVLKHINSPAAASTRNINAYLNDFQKVFLYVHPFIDQTLTTI